MRIEACASALREKRSRRSMLREKRRRLRRKQEKIIIKNICVAAACAGGCEQKKKDLHPIRGVRGGLRVDVLLHQLQRQYLYFCTNKYSCTSLARPLRPAGQSLGSPEERPLSCVPPHTASFRGNRHSQWCLRPVHSPAFSCTPRELACLHMYFFPRIYLFKDSSSQTAPRELFLLCTEEGSRAAVRFTRLLHKARTGYTTAHMYYTNVKIIVVLVLTLF